MEANIDIREREDYHRKAGKDGVSSTIFNSDNYGKSSPGLMILNFLLTTKIISSHTMSLTATTRLATTVDF